MKTQKLDHKKLNMLLTIENMKLPGGVIYEISDFQKYYIQEAAKSYMHIKCNDLATEGLSRASAEKMSTDILEEFGLLIDTDPFYELYQKSIDIRSKNSDYLKDPKVLKSLEYAELALAKLNEIEQPESNRKTIELTKAKERIALLCKELNIPIDEALNYIKN